MHIRHRSDDFIKETFFMLFFEQQIGEARNIALRIAEPFESENIIADPVQIDAHQTVAVHEHAVVPIHRPFAHAEEERKRLVVIRCRRTRNVADRDETSRKMIFHICLSCQMFSVIIL